MQLSDLPAVSRPLPWQLPPWDAVSDQMEQGRIHHALLIAGPQGIGKAAFALALARRLLCSAPVERLNCGRCHACELSRSGNHGDFRWLGPEGASGNIDIARVRAARDFAAHTAAHGRHKVIALAPAEALNRNAANAFLKTLEEPPAGTHILLVSHRPASLPATIRSRCQLQRLALPGSEESLAWLQAEVGSEREARELLALAAGRPLQALALRDDPTAAVLRRVPVAVQALLAGEGDIPGFIALTDDLPLEEVLQQLWYHIHGAVCQALVQGEPGGHSRHMLRLAQRIQALQRNLHSGANPNRQVQLEALLVALRRDMAQAARG